MDLNKSQILSILCAAILVSCNSRHDLNKPVVYSGTYSGENLRLFSANDCIDSIMVNDKKINYKEDTNAIEIDFRKLNIKLGDNVSVKIIHSKGCYYFHPLNEEVLHKVSN